MSGKFVCPVFVGGTPPHRNRGETEGNQRENKGKTKGKQREKQRKNIGETEGKQRKNRKRVPNMTNLCVKTTQQF